MKKLVFLILIIGVAFSCKKKSTIHITAKNAVTGKSYSGLRYSIVRSKTGLFESHYKTVASGTLNENGEAYLTKYFSKNWSHSITLERPDNYCYANKLHYYFSGGENIEANFEYAECGYWKLSIHNVNCQGADDTLIIDRIYLNGNDNIFIPVTLKGCIDNTGTGIVPEGSYSIKWTSIKNQIAEIHTDTVSISKSDTLVYIINY